MCIFYIIPGSKTHALVIASNRDEYLKRETESGDFRCCNDGGYVYFPLDKEAGGTWIAFDHGKERVGIARDDSCKHRGCAFGHRFACVLNFDEFRIGINCITTSKFKSRGMLPKNFIEGTKSALEYSSQLLHELDSYRGFSLVVGDQDGTYFITNMDCPGQRRSMGGISTPYSTPNVPNNDGQLIQLESGRLYGVGNRCFDDNESWPKIKEGKELIRQILYGGEQALQLPSSTPIAAVSLTSFPPSTSIVADSNFRVDTEVNCLDGEDEFENVHSTGNSTAVNCNSTTQTSWIAPSKASLEATAHRLLNEVLLNKTPHDDPLFETMSSELARCLMGICVAPVIINVEDEPGCYFKEIDTDIYGRPLDTVPQNRSRVLTRAELEAYILRHAISDDTATSTMANSDEPDSRELHQYYFATRTSTVIIVNPCSGADDDSGGADESDGRDVGECEGVSCSNKLEKYDIGAAATISDSNVNVSDGIGILLEHTNYFSQQDNRLLTIDIEPVIP